MKLKGLLKSFFILGLTLLPISFINAESLITTGGGIYVESTQEESFTLGNYTYDVDLIGNISSNDSPFLYKTATNNYINLQFVYGWINGKLYNISSYSNNTMRQGFVDKFCVRDSFPTTTNDICPESITAEEFYNLKGSFDSITFGLADSTNWNYAQTNFNPFSLCFKKGPIYYCAIYSYNGPYNGYSGTLGFTNSSFDSLSEYSRGSSPFSNAPTYYYSTGSCPSVGQLKSSSNLTPAVCYGGYGPNVMYGDQVAFVGGSGMSIFDVYNDYLTSFSDHSMNIQTWYDTYWAYYQNIAHDTRPFEGLKKSYLGLQFARQTFGNTRGVNGSYMILNYCYYVVNNIPDSQSTCVGSNVSTQYPGINMTDQDKQDIIDSVNDNFIVHRPGSGSIFLDPSQGLGGGGSSWGDEQCDGIPCLFEKFYQMFTSSKVNDVDFSQGGQGILPGYIALAFVIVVLFYVFKR